MAFWLTAPSHYRDRFCFYRDNTVYEIACTRTSSKGTFSALLALCEGPPVTGSSPHKGFLWCAHEQTTEKTMQMPVILEAMGLIVTSLQCCMWTSWHGNASCITELGLCPLLLPWIIFITSWKSNYMLSFRSVRLNYLSVPKLQRCNR